MQKIKMGILGVGNMGGEHLKSLLNGSVPEIEATAVADINPARLKWARELAGENLPCFDSAEAMLEGARLDALLIAVPHYDHPRFAIEALRRGLHVMTEKPAGVFTRQVREMNEAAARSGRVFGIMYNQRTNHIYRKMRELVQGGGLGRLRRVNWVITNWFRSQAYYDSGAWRATWSGEGGGVLLNQCPHNLDLLQWICGMPEKVYASMRFGQWHDIEVEDDVSALLTFPGGVSGVFVTSTGDYPGSNRFELTLDRGKLVAEENKLTLWELDESIAAFNAHNDVPFNTPGLKELTPDTDGLSEQHVGILNNFAAAVLRGAPLLAPGGEGINGLTLSNAMHLSSWLGKEIALPLDEALYEAELMRRVAGSKRKEANSVFVDPSSSYNN